MSRTRTRTRSPSCDATASRTRTAHTMLGLSLSSTACAACPRPTSLLRTVGWYASGTPSPRRTSTSSWASCSVPAPPELAEPLLVLLRWLHALAAIVFLGWCAVLWLEGAPRGDISGARLRFKDVLELSLIVFLAT